MDHTGCPDIFYKSSRSSRTRMPINIKNSELWKKLRLRFLGPSKSKLLLRSSLKHYKDRNYRFQWRYPFYLWSESAYKSTLFQDCSNFLVSNFWVPQYLHFWSILCIELVRKIGLKSHSSTPEKVMQIKHIPRREEIQGLQTSSVQCSKAQKSGQNFFGHPILL